MNDELKAKQLTVQQKLGRNLLLFQHLERVLKYIVPFTEQAGIDLKLSSATQQAGVVNCRDTLGVIIGRFYQNISRNDDGSTAESTGDTISIRAKLSLELNDIARDELVTRSKNLVEGRNTIAHHFHDQWSLASLEDMKQADQYLDD